MMIDFGNLRAAVQVARENHKMISDVVWCVLHSERRDDALSYAVDHLGRINHGTVNLGELVQWVVDGEPALKDELRRAGEVSDDLRYEFLSAWSFFVIDDPKSSPGLTLDGRSNYRFAYAWPRAVIDDTGWAHDDDSWAMRYNEPERQHHTPAERVDHTKWNKGGISPHLRQQEE